VNKYLTGKPEGDVEDLETRIADMLKAASRRTATDVPPFETNVTALMRATLELIRKTNDVGLISGPAGIGKGVAVSLYCRENATAVAVEVPRWQRNESGLVGLLFDAVENSTWNGQTPRSLFLVERLRHSNRPIILDNAQRITRGGLEWLFDFYDRTGCPLALVGNPEVLQTIRKNDQHFSRIGINKEIRLDSKRCRDYARKMVEAKVENPVDGLVDLAAQVVEQRGHLRALRKQLDLMLDLAATDKLSGDQIRAFHAAHQQLVRDYEL
jgi:DNA transposition AAA+ family ATPase